MAEVSTSARHSTVELPGAVSVTIDEYAGPGSGDNEGGGTAVLVLHGGAGPRSVAGFAAALASQSRVIVPTHPGFDGTPRPDGFDRVTDLASAYLDLLDELGVSSALVFGSSVGGWIAAEMAVRDNRRVLSGVVLANSAGIAPEAGDDVVDVAAVSPQRMGELAFHDPRFRPNVAAFTDQQRAVMAANQRTLAAYAGSPYLHDPKLRGRLHRVPVPVLVLWGEHDGVIPLAYGRRLAASFPAARFVPVPGAGHFPFIENPTAVFDELGRFAAALAPGALVAAGARAE